MILHGDMSGRHGTDNEADGRRRAGRIGRNEARRQAQGGVQSPLARHAVHARTGGKVLGEGILDDLHQARGGTGRLDFHFMQQLYHQAREALVRAGDADGGVDLDQHILSGADVHLETSGLVEGRVDQGQQFLMANVRAVFLRVALQLLLAQFAMVVAVEQLKVVAAVLDGFEAGLVEEDDDLMLAGFGRFALRIDGGDGRGYFERRRGGGRRSGCASLLVGAGRDRGGRRRIIRRRRDHRRRIVIGTAGVGRHGCDICYVQYSNYELVSSKVM